MALISDPDGWTNLRKGPEVTSEVILKIAEGEIFWYNQENTSGDWVEVYYPKNKYSLHFGYADAIEGFIHRSRLKPLSSVEAYEGKDFEIAYKISPFRPEEHIVDVDEEYGIGGIDGRPAWGTDLALPYSQVDEMRVRIGEQEIWVHPVFYSDIFNCGEKFTYYRVGENYIAWQGNSDGGGYYEIAWVFNANGLVQRLIGSAI